ncbi:uncharacterized protein FAM241A isoform X7 [Anser cygnoides]|uniref:uncharacterized protein FAM241A isoform X7 n=1 Tax=Anser cygnoides TaxID=8845 RepID=UPI0006707963|nr:uncharacterized protein LOC106038660 isoform X1 [Anser cygnoides]
MPDSSRRATAAAHILGTDRQETSGRSKRKILKREQASPRRAPGGSGQETPRWTAVSEMGDIGMPFQQLLARSSQIHHVPANLSMPRIQVSEQRGLWGIFSL